MNFPVVSGAWTFANPRLRCTAPTQRAQRGTLSRCASRTRSSPPTSAVRETDFGAENVASHRRGLGAGHLSAEFSFIGSRNLMLDKLLFGVRMLAFAQPREMFGADCTMQAPLLGEPALPFAVALLVAAPIVLFPARQTPRMGMFAA